MKTTNLFITKDNWSGESAQLAVTEFAGCFEWEQNGSMIELHNRQRMDGDVNTPGDGYGWVQWDIYVDGERTDNHVGKFDKDSMWEACTEDADMTRQCSDLAASGLGHVGAAAKLLFNTM